MRTAKVDASGNEARPERSEGGMRLWLGVFLATTACVTPARVILSPAEAPVAQAKETRPLEIGDHEKLTPENPFSADAVVPCRDEDDRASARQAVQAIGVEIYALDEGSTVAAQQKAEAQLKKLLDTPCFELAKADLRDPLEFDSAYALRSWWMESGGENALIHAVAKEDDNYPTIRVAPPSRATRADTSASPWVGCRWRRSARRRS